MTEHELRIARIVREQHARLKARGRRPSIEKLLQACKDVPGFRESAEAIGGFSLSFGPDGGITIKAAGIRPPGTALH